MYVQVAINNPQINGIYDYHLPGELAEQVKPGCLVTVPFGKQSMQGVVLRLAGQSEMQETRPVTSLLDPLPVLTSLQIQQAQWLSEETLSPLSACLELMLPPGLSQHADTLYHLNKTADQADESLSSLQRRMLALFNQRGDLRGRQLAAAFPHLNWKTSAQSLVKQGRLVAQSVLPPPSVRPKMVRTAQLACSPEEIPVKMGNLSKGAAYERRLAVLQFLMHESMPVDVAWVYAASGGNLQDLQKLAEMGLVILGESQVWRDPIEKLSSVLQEAPQLTHLQQVAWQTIQTRLLETLQGHTVLPVLLYGVTGSGKTEIYLEAVSEILRQGRQAIILIPEISLTPQTVRRFSARFPGKVGLVHSRLSPGERYDTWRRAREGQLPVIIGPRSALFAPLPSPGLIILDEFDDESYYQSEMPRYHAVTYAINYARLTGSLLMLGSATPDVSLMYRARKEGWDILILPERFRAHTHAVGSESPRDSGFGTQPGDLMEGSDLKTAYPADDQTLPLPPVTIVDMRRELKAGNRSIFSNPLQQALRDVLQEQQQAILFLNRRGSTTYVFCRDCGYTLRCPRCDLPLTYHTANAALICHQCNYHRLMPKTCPRCGSSHIRQYGTGTEKVEAEVKTLFPESRVLRWDTDSVQHKDSHEILLSHFINHHADILIGTRMLAKGLDLPLVTLVGIVLADVGLNFPDYRANERVFQLLMQVAGRAGRSPLGGQVILQTFEPDHYAIRAAAGHDYPDFFQKEIEYRRHLGYPPFYRLARLEYRHAQADQAKAAALVMAENVKGWIDKGEHRASEMLGPVPCFFSRQNGLYRWQIVLRSPDPIALLRGKPLVGWQVEIDPPSLL